MESIVVAAFFLRSMPDCCEARVPLMTTFLMSSAAWVMVASPGAS